MRSVAADVCFISQSVDWEEGSVVRRIVFDKVAEFGQNSSKYRELSCWVGCRPELTADRNGLVLGLARITALFP
jgi:hypothetical protein